jgi:UDP-GlcNAc3NAcA epimerase
MRILTVVGARPQFVKAAVVGRAIAARPGLEEILVHSGQHHDDDMSSVFFDELGLAPPAWNLGIHGGSHAAMTGAMMVALEPVLEAVAPDLVLVYGDADTTLAAALVAAKAGVRLAHVEAGLRAFNPAMAEEINRVVVDRLSDFLFCPTARACANLAREGIDEGVHRVGDVMLDAAQSFAPLARARSSILENIGVADGGYDLATVHRAETTDEAQRLAGVLDFLRTRPGPVVFPCHPRTRRRIAEFGLSTDGLLVTSPLGYLDMMRLVMGARLLLTDSGGLQKEACFHRVPCVTLRSQTEWVETIESGWNRLWQGGDYAPRREVSDFGDGKAGEAIAAILAEK